MNTPEYPSWEAAEQACREQGLTPLRNLASFTVRGERCVGEVLSVESLGPGTYEARAFLARVIPPEPAAAPPPERQQGEEPGSRCGAWHRDGGRCVKPEGHDKAHASRGYRWPQQPPPEPQQEAGKAGKAYAEAAWRAAGQHAAEQIAALRAEVSELRGRLAAVIEATSTPGAERLSPNVWHERAERAERERHELRERCEQVAKLLALANPGQLELRDLWRWSDILRGERPIPGSECDPSKGCGVPGEEGA